MLLWLLLLLLLLSLLLLLLVVVVVVVVVVVFHYSNISFICYLFIYLFIYSLINLLLLLFVFYFFCFVFCYLNLWTSFHPLYACDNSCPGQSVYHAFKEVDELFVVVTSSIWWSPELKSCNFLILSPLLFNNFHRFI